MRWSFERIQRVQNAAASVVLGRYAIPTEGIVATEQDGWKTQDGKITKKCRPRPRMHSLEATFFRNSTILSLPAVLLRKVSNIVWLLVVQRRKLHLLKATFEALNDPHRPSYAAMQRADPNLKFRLIGSLSWTCFSYFYVWAQGWHNLTTFCRPLDWHLIHLSISLEFQHGRHLVFRNFNMVAVTS